MTEPKILMHDDVFQTMVSGEHDPATIAELRREMSLNDQVGKYPYKLSTENWIYEIRRCIDQNTGRDLTDQYGTQYNATQKHK